MLRFIMNTVSPVVPALFPNSLLKFLRGFQFMTFLLEQVHFLLPQELVARIRSVAWKRFALAKSGSVEPRSPKLRPKTITEYLRVQTSPV